VRIAVISDIHANLPALEAVLDDIRRQGPDLTVNLGDHFAGPIDPRGVAERLMAEDFPTIRGNHDRWLLEPPDGDLKGVDRFAADALTQDQYWWLRTQPATMSLPDVFMCHGTPQSDEAPWLDAWWTGRTHTQPDHDDVAGPAEGLDYPVLVCGHTHVARAVRLKDGRLIVNPGSVGLQFNLGMPDARYAILERRGESWGASFFAVPYDREAAASLADANGFPAWRAALLTGWLPPDGLF
jgi:putative phosphoesterase